MMVIRNCEVFRYGAFLVTFLHVVRSWDPNNHTWEVTEALRPAIITVDWQKKNKTVFKSVNYAGYIGILTALKPVGVFSHSSYD